MKLTGVRSTAIRIIGSALFVLGGIFLVLMTALWVPSFWYVPCFYALLLVGGLWAWRPRIGAALSLGPLVAVGSLLRCLSGITLATAILLFLAALVCVACALAKRTGRIRVPLLFSLCFLSASFFTDRLFTNKILIRSYQVGVALDGEAPWGTVGPEWSDNFKPIVLYRRVGDTYCYIAFKSQELRDRLANKNETSIPMQINIFQDFGKERGYNVRSVDGLLLADGKKVCKDAEQFGGQIEISGTSGRSANCW